MIKMLNTTRKEEVAKRLGITLTDEINEALRAAYNGLDVVTERIDMATQDAITLMLAGLCGRESLVLYMTSNTARAQDLSWRLNAAGYKTRWALGSDEIPEDSRIYTGAEEYDVLFTDFDIVHSDILLNIRNVDVHMIIDEYSSASIDLYGIQDSYHNLVAESDTFPVQCTFFQSVLIQDETYTDGYGWPELPGHDTVDIKPKHRFYTSNIEIEEVSLEWDYDNYNLIFETYPEVSLFCDASFEVNDNDDERAIIYAPTAKAVEELAEWVEHKSHPAYIHEKLPVKQRMAALNDFLSGKKRTLIATPAFGTNAVQGRLDKIIICGIPLGMNELEQIIDRSNSPDCKVKLFYTKADIGYNFSVIKRKKKLRFGEYMLEGIIKVNQEIQELL